MVLGVDDRSRPLSPDSSERSPAEREALEEGSAFEQRVLAALFDRPTAPLLRLLSPRLLARVKDLPTREESGASSKPDSFVRMKSTVPDGDGCSGLDPFADRAHAKAMIAAYARDMGAGRLGDGVPALASRGPDGEVLAPAAEQGNAHLHLDAGRIPVEAVDKGTLDRIAKANGGAKDALEVRGGALTQLAQGGIEGERFRAEREKFEFDPERKKRAAEKMPEWDKNAEKNNGEHAKKAGEVIDKLDALARSDKSPKDKEKEEKKLRGELDEHTRRIRPPFSLEGVTAQVDRIMNDPKIDQKEKKKQIDEIRKDYGMDKRGSHSFSHLITNRLGDVYKGSEARMKKLGKDIDETGKSKLKEIEKTHGKDSVEYATMKADIDAAKKAQSLEKDELKGKSKFLKNLYPSLWKKFLNVMSKIFSIAALPLSLVPGVGPALGVAAGLMGSATGFASGDWKAGLGGLLSALPGAGSLIGGRLGAVGAAAEASGGGLGRVATVATRGLDAVNKVRDRLPVLVYGTRAVKSDGWGRAAEVVAASNLRSGVVTASNAS